MKPLFIVAEMIGSPDKNNTTFSFKIVFSVMTITVLLPLATHE